MGPRITAIMTVGTVLLRRRREELRARFGAKPATLSERPAKSERSPGPTSDFERCREPEVFRGPKLGAARVSSRGPFRPGARAVWTGEGTRLPVGAASVKAHDEPRGAFTRSDAGLAVRWITRRYGKMSHPSRPPHWDYRSNLVALVRQMADDDWIHGLRTHEWARRIDPAAAVPGSVDDAQRAYAYLESLGFPTYAVREPERWHNAVLLEQPLPGDAVAWALRCLIYDQWKSLLLARLSYSGVAPLREAGRRLQERERDAVEKEAAALSNRFQEDPLGHARAAMALPSLYRLAGDLVAVRRHADAWVWHDILPAADTLTLEWQQAMADWIRGQGLPVPVLARIADGRSGEHSEELRDLLRLPHSSPAPLTFVPVV